MVLCVSVMNLSVKWEGWRVPSPFPCGEQQSWGARGRGTLLWGRGSAVGLREEGEVLQSGDISLLSLLLPLQTQAGDEGGVQVGQKGEDEEALWV